MPDLLSSRNKYLTVGPGVVLTTRSDAVIAACDPIFGRHEMRREVSSGRRSPEHQLEMVIAKAREYKLTVIFGPGDVDKKEEGGRYIWQPAWSEILRLGYIIAPPRDAAVLCDYRRPLLGGGSELIRSGSVRKASGHFYDDFDVSGRRGDQTAAQAASVDDETPVLKECLAAGIGIAYILPEKVNGAVHVGVARAQNA